MKVVGDYTLTATILGKGQYGEVVLAKSNHQKGHVPVRSSKAY